MCPFNTLVNLSGKKEFRHLQAFIKSAKPFVFGKTIGYKIAEYSPMPIASVPLTVNDSFNMNQLILPFPVTAIVYKDFAMVLADDGRGRYTITNYNKLTLLGVNREVELISVGYIDINKSKEIQQIAGHISKVYLLNNNELSDITEPNMQVTLLNCVTPAIVGLAEINTIDRFVLEIANSKPKVYKDKYVPLLEQRPSYIILYPKEIRKYMKTEHETIGVKSGHERRAHLRTYPDDAVRYPNAHGKTIRIPSVWIGSTEATVGDKKYRVVLDYYIDKEGNIN
jgi:hypothetical protein